MDTHLLGARLYSGSGSPGGGPYRYTAAIGPEQAATLVAAFNGGFKMADAHGGYYTEGRVIVPLVAGAASLVIYSDGTVTVGSWGTTVRMTPSVLSVRQNLVPLVAGSLPTPTALSPHWQVWGDTCGAQSCATGVPGIEHQWRSAVGVTADGALVYVTGAALDPPQLARVLVRAGVVQGMELDINPHWPGGLGWFPAPARCRWMVPPGRLACRAHRWPAPGPSSNPPGHATSSPCRRDPPPGDRAVPLAGSSTPRS